MIIRHSTLSEGTSNGTPLVQGGGGCLWVEGVQVTIEHSTLRSCRSLAGGVLLARQRAFVSIASSNLTDNAAVCGETCSLPGFSGMQNLVDSTGEGSGCRHQRSDSAPPRHRPATLLTLPSFARPLW